MLKIVLTTTFLAGLCALSMNCSKDACQTYADDLVAKYQACGITVSTTSSGSTSGTTTQCTGAVQTLATCLDACLPKVDCGCTKDPTGTDCATKLKPYSDCASACAGSTTGG